MKKTMKKWMAALLAMAVVLSMAACTQGPVPTDPTTQPTTAPVAVVPERGQPDKSNLMYTGAIESYKKSDWTANWIWTKGCSEDSYVAFRKTFTLDEAVESTTAYISAVDKYVLWVNGEMLVLDGSLKRGHMRHSPAMKLPCLFGDIVILILSHRRNIYKYIKSSWR